ncbi:diguanylate cyclase [Pectobacterium sp. B1J-3]|uniref:sensor domain-containing diguanylate cyclase n=1 Tax=Pectobacterium sp. B1J-3 TaxID=3385371 RepID=UPI0039069090
MNSQLVDVDLITKFDSQAKLYALNNAYAIAEFDLTGRVIEVNSRFCDMMGYHKSEVLMQPHELFLLEEQRQDHDRFWVNIINGSISSGEFKRKTKQNDIIWIHAAYTPIIDDRGCHIGVIKLALDITQEKQHTSENRAKLDAIESSQGVIEFDKHGYIIRANNNYLTLTGYKKQEILGQHHQVLCTRDDILSPEYQAFWTKLRQGQSVSGRFHRLGKNNKPFWIQATYSPVVDSEGEVRKIIKYAHNITQNVQTEKKAKQQGAILDILLTVHDSFLLDHNLSSACDKVFQRLLNVTSSQFGFIAIVQENQEGQSLYIPSISNLSWDDTTREWYNQQRKTNGGLIFSKLDNLFGHVVTHNTIVCTNDLPSHHASKGFPPGHPHLFAFLGIPITHDGKAIGMIALANRQNGYDQDVIELLAPLVKTLGIIIHARSLEDERRQIEERLRFNAGHDFLTGLPNRGSFFEQANTYFHHQKPGEDITKSCLAVIDIDFFKKINDAHGHLAGDAVLKELALLMHMSLRKEDIVARIGGEEFIMLLKDVSAHEAFAAIERIRQLIEQHTLLYDRQLLKFTISVGVALWQPGLASVDDWIRLADEKLYVAKRQGRNCVK